MDQQVNVLTVQASLTLDFDPVKNAEVLTCNLKTLPQRDGRVNQETCPEALRAASLEHAMQQQQERLGLKTMEGEHDLPKVVVCYLQRCCTMSILSHTNINNNIYN